MNRGLFNFVEKVSQHTAKDFPNMLRKIFDRLVEGVVYSFFDQLIKVADKVAVVTHGELKKIKRF